MESLSRDSSFPKLEDCKQSLDQPIKDSSYRQHVGGKKVPTMGGAEWLVILIIFLYGWIISMIIQTHRAVHRIEKRLSEEQEPTRKANA